MRGLDPTKDCAAEKPFAYGKALFNDTGRDASVKLQPHCHKKGNIYEKHI
jgi:hypothetical protein